MMAIKNFLGHTSVTTTERYAELTQSTVDQKIKEWNRRWFPSNSNMAPPNYIESANRINLPDFLK